MTHEPTNAAVSDAGDLESRICDKVRDAVFGQFDQNGHRYSIRTGPATITGAVLLAVIPTIRELESTAAGVPELVAERDRLAGEVERLRKIVSEKDLEICRLNNRSVLYGESGRAG